MRESISRLFILVINVYRTFISPLSPPTCRFHPSCSEYTRGAIIKFGPIKGGWLGLKRLLKCHPWHPGGYDPI